MQGGSYLVARVGSYSLVLAWDFSIVVVRVNSVVGLILSSCGKLLSSCGVRFVSISSRAGPFYVMSSGLPGVVMESFSRSAGLCALWLGCGGSMGEVLLLWR